VEKIFLRKSLWCLVFLVTAFAAGFSAAEDFSHQIESSRPSEAVPETLKSYEHALQTWKSPEDISAWIGSNFSYDTPRSMRLSETQVTQQNPPSIYTPSELFSIKSGTCVDLSRFAVETLKIVSPQNDPRYLMIEFDPVTIKGNLLRRHWMASFRRDGKIYFFADTQRPGIIAGPFSGLEEFIRVYEGYRSRKIVAFREADSYRKRYRIRTLKQSSSQNH
jgi:hypothetical protein